VPSGFKEEELAIRLEAPDDNTRLARFTTLLREPRSRKELVMLLLLPEPEFGKPKMEKWVDNELQSLKKMGMAETSARGVWMLRGGV
jgi:hypothetical protein